MSSSAALDTPSGEPEKGASAEAAKPPAAKKAASPFYRQELDWLRFCAFFAVFMHHWLPLDPRMYLSRGVPRPAAAILVGAGRAGAFGVDLFFVLSSYLITELLIREDRARGGIDVRSFYVRRILRIWPLYYLFVLFTIFVVPKMGIDTPLPAPYIAGFLLFVGNWVCAANGYPGSVANVLWSVSIEEQFYISWPLILSRLKVAAIWYLAPVMFVVATATRIYLAQKHVTHPAMWCNTLARLDPIAAGAMIALVSDRIMPRLTTLRRVLLASGALLIMLVMGVLNTYAGYQAIFGYPLVSLAAVMLLLSFLGLRSSASSAAMAMAYLGRISYGLYVFHMLVIALVHKLHAPIPARFLLSLFGCIAVSWASYRWLESPFLKLKARFTHVPSGAAATKGAGAEGA